MLFIDDFRQFAAYFLLFTSLISNNSGHSFRSKYSAIYIVKYYI